MLQILFLPGPEDLKRVVVREIPPWIGRSLLVLTVYCLGIFLLFAIGSYPAGSPGQFEALWLMTPSQPTFTCMVYESCAYTLTARFGRPQEQSRKRPQIKHDRYRDSSSYVLQPGAIGI